jgi:hypothetical protein
MSKIIKIALLAIAISVWIPSTAVALPATKDFTPVKHEVKQVIVYAKKEKPLKMDCNALRPLLALYDWNVEMAMKISNAESGCNPANHNRTDVHRNRDGTILCLGSWNFLSVGCGHYKKGEDINDIALNAKKGYAIYKSSGNSFKQWTTCKDIAGCK